MFRQAGEGFFMLLGATHSELIGANIRRVVGMGTL